MKSDVIRKRARHEGRKGSSPSDTPTATPSESTQTSPLIGASVAPPIQDIHPPMLPSSFDFSAAGFEFSQVTHDSTDRLTYQHDLDRDAALRMTLSPGTTYLESLNYPGSATVFQGQSFYSSDSTADNKAGNNGNQCATSDTASPDLSTGTGQAAFQDDGFKRRRVSPEGDGNPSAEAEETFGTVEESASTPYDVPKPPTLDAFNAYYPYPFTFTSSAPNLFHPPMVYLPEDQIDVGEAMETAVASIGVFDKDSDSPNYSS